MRSTSHHKNIRAKSTKKTTRKVTLSRFNRLKRLAHNQYLSKLESKGQERFGTIDDPLPSAALPGPMLFPILDRYLEELWKRVIEVLNSEQIILSPRIAGTIYRNLIEPELRLEIEHHMANYLNYRVRRNLAPQAGRKHLEGIERIEERLIDSARARVELLSDSLGRKDPAGLGLRDLPAWLRGPPATGPNATVRKWRDYLPVEVPTSESIPWRQAEQSIKGSSEALKKSNTFPSPEGLRWEEVRLTFVSPSEIRVRARKIVQDYSCRQMGFIDKRKGQPNQLWLALGVLVGKHGEAEWHWFTRTGSPEKRNVTEATIKRLRAELRRFFELKADPIPCKQGVYKAVFTISSEMEFQKSTSTKSDLKEVYEADRNPRHLPEKLDRCE